MELVLLCKTVKGIVCLLDCSFKNLRQNIYRSVIFFYVEVYKNTYKGNYQMIVTKEKNLSRGDSEAKRIKDG